MGTIAQKRWPDLPEYVAVPSWELAGVNYCKYYFYDEYAVTKSYPFASTKEGAGKQDGNYSIRAVSDDDNVIHGRALNRFYSDYRVVPGEKLWVKVDS
ncbi:hypothetical protein [Microbispora sp. H10670]|uniref:NucA/NucB deoxyribonuclease domain-containing protein n=1 Tax=Microbispora sp. H10670 TaxID=2729108 RepID=UPI001602AB13|nr:hypothetical protein [Microbispora sp. H10670]